MRRALLSLALIAPLFSACSTEKAPVDDDFSDLAQLDTKSDAFSYRMKIVGSLDFNTTSAAVSYTKNPRFRAFKFSGAKGTAVETWVRSTNGGDAVAWILDNSFRTVASNDDADGTTVDSHIKTTLPGNRDASITTYYLVFRDYYLDSAKFTAQLIGNVATDFFSCTTDSDCVAVPAHVCCPECQSAAVNKDQKDAYASAPLVCTTHICPALCILETRVAECNKSTSQCEMVHIEDIACGGFIRDPHLCPDGYQCTGAALAHDGPGSCTPTPPPAQACGGITARPCPTGQVCVDNPDDSCDPSTGGADCGGICQDAPADCRTNGCAGGGNCQICWGSYACVPVGAEC